MNYRRLGSSNLRVSPLCLGTMMFGEQTPDEEAARIVASARDRGLNFIDTADVYNGGRSEEVVGRLLAGQRHDWVLASKIGNAVGKGPNQSHYSRQWLIRGVEASLVRLGTDFLDILYLHRDYHEENLEEALWALGDLIRAGKLRSYGLSNFRGWRIAEVMRLCERLGVPQPVVCQPYYNMLNRGPEVEILPACGHYGLGVVPYSPIARGVLTGKYLPGQAPAADTRAGRGDSRILATEFREESLQIAQKLVAHSAARGVQAGHFATAWVLANPIVTAVIAGPRTLAQMDDYYAALDVAITPEDEAVVNGWVTPGHASSHGYNDPNYPFYGRPVAAG
ncbi:NADP-dependent oxidoreductase [Achromobacter sp. HZ01]|uniref:aldo/keto reductase n=1 Tax=Achromobacter sp. HZ01 TaxID=1416886 RepID=UPI000DC2ACD4|nr:aldo/keto reductase [Achromobacter sp. HZ01]RAP65107.1 NADP-dependent oxidoreductase [Achromobacter sp. HZ01]